MLLNAALISVMIGLIALFVVHPSAPQEPWGHRLACVIPLSVIAGTILAWVGGAA